MIVCLCHRVSERDIRAAVAEGTRCFEQLQDETRVASSCGCCLECAQDVFDHAVSAAGDRRPVHQPVLMRLSVSA
jgi:bacterioferritin-associated ferredoxin